MKIAEHLRFRQQFKRFGRVNIPRHFSADHNRARRDVALNFSALAQNQAFGGHAAFNFTVDPNRAFGTQRPLKGGFGADDGF